jgi:hypothetical protein
MSSPWLRLDDEFPDHPKVVGLTDAAFRLAITGLCYSHRLRTDGFVPAVVLTRPQRITNELIRTGLWVPDETSTGYLIHDYLNHQESRAEIEERAKQRRAAGQKGARARWQRP